MAKKVLGYTLSLLGFIIIFSNVVTTLKYIKNPQTGFLSVHMIGSYLGLITVFLIGYLLIRTGSKMVKKGRQA